MVEVSLGLDLWVIGKIFDQVPRILEGCEAWRTLLSLLEDEPWHQIFEINCGYWRIPDICI